jgi:hypothetical protein
VSGSSIGVVVLGMSRSGTSAVAGSLAASGFFAVAEDDSHPNDRANPRGYFESTAIVAANGQVLDELDATWFEPPSIAAQRAAASRAHPRLQAELDALLNLAGDRPLVLKDPRIGVLLELWWPLLAGRLHPVLVIRDPVEVAISLQRRDGMPTPFGLAAWELHTAGLLRALRQRPVTVTHFADLTGTPDAAEHLVTDLKAQIAAPRADALEPGNARLGIDPLLRRNRAGAREHDDHLTRHQAELYAWLAALRPGTRRIDPPAPLIERGHDTARALVAAERARLRTDPERIRALEYALAAAGRERERLRELVRSEQARLTALLEQEQARLTAILRNEQARLEAELEQSMERERELRVELERTRDLAPRFPGGV